MSTIFTLIVILGLIGAATFLVGFTKGVREAVSEYRNPQPEGAWSDEGHYGLSALFSVVASAVVIALVGVAARSSPPPSPSPARRPWRK
jgi:L-asparagine transporter-like permease